MIQSAMMFALGIFVSGLVWLAFSVALVRRARRLTERRLLAGIATRRAEFDVERDELRARHAVQMHRLEREVSRVLDMATAYRLEADLKERDLISLRAELEVRSEDVSDVETRLQSERDLIQDAERRAAEAGSTSRSVQHQLSVEIKRRAAAEEAREEASILAEQRREALVILRSENNALRERLGEEPGSPLPFEHDMPKLPRAVAEADDEAVEVAEPADVEEAEVAVAAAEETEQQREEAAPSGGASVVPLPTRPRPVAAEGSDQSAATVAEAARDLKRIADDAEEKELAAARAQQPRMPEAAPLPDGHVGELVALRMAPPAGETQEPEPETEVSEKAESQFFEALAEIRALKRAGNQGGD